MFNRIVLSIGCIFLLFLAWVVVLNMKSPLQEQTEFIAAADTEIAKGTYANAEPYLAQAVAYNTNQTFGVLEKLKDVYLKLGDTQNYVNTLETETSRTDCTASVYQELAQYYIDQNKLSDALPLLKTGIGRTNDQGLIDFYEAHRYAFDTAGNTYDDVTAFFNGGIQVEKAGLWGIANSKGSLIIPCNYPQISTYDSTSKCVVAVQSDQKVVALNTKNQVVAIFDKTVAKLGNISQNYIPMQLDDGKWIIANGQLISNGKEYDGLGTVSNTAIAIESGGKWGVLSLTGKMPMIIPYEYDGIVTDISGACYAQSAAFVQKDGKTYLFSNGAQLSDPYEDAKPFTDSGMAAVKQSGKWGFSDATGQIRISPQFDDALSFTKVSSDESLAAVKIGDKWGYVNSSGKVVIEPQFMDARDFSGGTAPVKTDQGWQFIKLVEYE